MEKKIKPDKAKAIALFARKRVMPLYIEIEDDEIQRYIGTGTLFSTAGRFFLITARHLFANDHGVVPNDEMLTGYFERVAFHPDSQTRDELNTIGQGTLMVPRQPRYDILVFELQDPDTIDMLRSGWCFLELSNLGLAPTAGEFMLTGYYDDPEKAKQNLAPNEYATIITTQLDTIPRSAEIQEDGYDSEIDLLFNYQGQSSVLAGDKLEKPALNGMSGGAIWTHDDSTSTTLWTPESSIKLVAIQSQYLKDDYFRGKHIRLLIDMLRQCAVDISQLTGD